MTDSDYNGSTTSYKYTGSPTGGYPPIPTKPLPRLLDRIYCTLGYCFDSIALFFWDRSENLRKKGRYYDNQ